MSLPEHILQVVAFATALSGAYFLGRAHEMLLVRQRWRYHPLDSQAVARPPHYAPPLTEGMVRKGGQNAPPTDEQLANRPAPPAPFRAA